MPYVIAVIAGILNMLQSGTNATLHDKLKVGPVVPAIVVYAGGIVGVLAASPFLAKGTGTLATNAGSVPWWGWTGGLLGAVYVVATLTLAKNMGAGAFTAITLTAAIATSLVLDHFGLLGFEVRSLSTLRVLGGVLMIGGVALIARF